MFKLLTAFTILAALAADAAAAPGADPTLADLVARALTHNRELIARGHEVDGRVEAMNPAASRLFDRPAALVVGKDASTIIAGPVGVGTALEGLGRRRDGTTFPIELSVSEMPVGDRRMQVAVIRDVSERKRFERHQTKGLWPQRRHKHGR